MNATRVLMVRSTTGRRLEAVAVAALLGFVAALQFSIAIADILLAVTLLAWVACVVTGRERVEVPGSFWPLAAYAGMTLVSSAFSTNPANSFTDSKQLVLFLIVPAAYRLARGDRALTVTDVIVSVGAVSAIVGIVQYGILHYDNLGRRPQGTLTHYMTYSGILMLVITAAAARLMNAKENRLWTALVMPALLVALALTFTRSAWVGACAALAWYLPSSATDVCWRSRRSPSRSSSRSLRRASPTACTPCSTCTTRPIAIGWPCFARVCT